MVWFINNGKIVYKNQKRKDLKRLIKRKTLKNLKETNLLEVILTKQIKHNIEKKNLISIFNKLLWKNSNKISWIVPIGFLMVQINSFKEEFLLFKEYKVYYNYIKFLLNYMEVVHQV